MTGGSFASADEVVATQPQAPVANSNKAQNRAAIARVPFDDTLSERDWNTKLCSCADGTTSSKKSSAVYYQTRNPYTWLEHTIINTPLGRGREKGLMGLKASITEKWAGI